MSNPNLSRPEWPRRKVLKVISTLGVGSAVFGRALTTLAAGSAEVSQKMIRHAEWIAGLDFTADDRKLMLDGVNEALRDYAALREVEVDNGVYPALAFDPSSHAGTPAGTGQEIRRAEIPVPAGAQRPVSDEDVAFSSVATLARLIRSRKIGSEELTLLYISRLKKHDPVLRCVITLTEDLALEQARTADREIAAGNYRGPLHGIPWGAKDLLAVAGYPTTWGAAPYKDQVRPETATVAARLAEAGAVLVAKTSVGALAWGDVWFGGTTKNPWNTEQGSSGSSAGSASATAAGLVGFAIGTETWGSIVSPCTRCGATGLRPSFGRVSRHGAMALSWSMDKIGPITRSVEDCALVFNAIHGADGRDPSALNRPFCWPPDEPVNRIRVGYVEELFDKDRGEMAEDEEDRARLREWQEFDRSTLRTLREMGIELVPIRLPSGYPVGSLGLILTAEAAAAFDDLTRTNRDDELTRQSADAWPNVFRQGQLIPAVEYIRANRIRTMVMREMDEALSGVDVYLTPSYGGDNLLLTNLTGHPCVVLPNGFRASDGTPTSITFMGKLHDETRMLTVAKAYQEATAFHRKRPPLA